MPGYQIVLQAEDALYSGNCSNDNNHDDFFGQEFINFPSNGGIVEFQNVDGGEGVILLSLTVTRSVMISEPEAL
ncbi:MAG: hypothetical protein P8Y99_14055 [Calditrichaceae bacterium]